MNQDKQEKTQKPLPILEPKPVKIIPEIHLCGGWSKVFPVDHVITDYLKTHTKRVNEEYLKLKKEELKKIEPISWKRQTVDGYNTIVTCKVNDKDMVDFFIYEHHSGEIRYVGCTDTDVKK